MVDKQTIIQRSKSYGNNFPFLKKIWCNYLKLRYGIDVPLTSADVAFMFSLHKISRLANAPDDEDTLRDMINYAWLGIDYDQYEKLLSEEEQFQNKVEKLLDSDDLRKQDLENLLLQTDEKDYWCFFYNRPCIYYSDWGMVKECPLSSDNYQDCEFSSPIEIN